MMCDLILLRGLPGSGKSTYARGLSNVQVCEADQFFIVDGIYQYDATMVRDAHRDCMMRVENCLRAGESVAVANTFVRNVEMLDYVRIARQVDARVSIIEMKTQFASIHGVPQEKIDLMRARWEEVDFAYLGLAATTSLKRIS